MATRFISQSGAFRITMLRSGTVLASSFDWSENGGNNGDDEGPSGHVVEDFMVGISAIWTEAN